MTETYVKRSKTQMAAFEEAREIELQIKELVARKERVLKAGEMAVEPVRVFVGSVPETTMGKMQMALQRRRQPTHIRDIYADIVEMGFTSKAAKSRTMWNLNSDLAKKVGGGVFVRGKERGTWGLVNYDAPIVDFTENRGRKASKRK